jgi:hypothetical protein
MPSANRLLRTTSSSARPEQVPPPPHLVQRRALPRRLPSRLRQAHAAFEISTTTRGRRADQSKAKQSDYGRSYLERGLEAARQFHPRLRRGVELRGEAGPDIRPRGRRWAWLHAARPSGANCSGLM